jgi:hypothetical protein
LEVIYKDTSMILLDFYHPGRANYTSTTEFGIDSLVFQDRKDHYLNFPYSVTYQFSKQENQDLIIMFCSIDIF